MGSSDHVGIQLPKRIYQELGFPNGSELLSRKHKTKAAPRTRKELRKAARNGNKTHRAQSNNLSSSHKSSRKLSETSGSLTHAEPDAVARKKQSISVSRPRRALDPHNGVNHESTRSRKLHSPDEPAESITKSTRKRLAQDDAEIDALEKALGQSGKRSYSTAFETDGLDYLLGDLNGSQLNNTHGSDETFQPRDSLRGRKSELRDGQAGSSEAEDSDAGYSSFESFETSSSIGESQADSQAALGGKALDIANPADVVPRRKAREDPYRAPQSDQREAAAKYISPSLRVTDSKDSENRVRLQRQLKGQFNRLSESNLNSIVANVEALSLSQSRHLVFESLMDLLTASILDKSALQDTFLILIAAFVAALSKRFGAEFAVHAITRLDGELERLQAEVQNPDLRGKECINIFGIISNLYVFQVIECTLMYDYVRLCLSDLSEYNTEILLRILRISGSQLRHDDPSALKDIVNRLNAQLADIDSSHLSVRTKFMVETITSLKDGKTKYGMAAASIAAEHTVKMKKVLGTYNQQNPKMLEPLSCGLTEIRTLGRQGKWQLIGSGPREAQIQNASHRSEIGQPKSTIMHPQEALLGHSEDLISLARQAGMNTDVRRSIFIAIMSASDCEDAETRLRKLRLSRNQNLEIAGVILRCTASEADYNPFYAVIATRMTSDHRSKMAFKFAVWNLFKRMGESFDEDAESVVDDSDEALEVRSVVNVARMYGTLIVNGSQDLGILKILNLMLLQPKTQLFVEVLLLSIIRETQGGDPKRRDERKLVAAFTTSKHTHEMASSLRYFVRSTLSKSDVLDSNDERRMLKWACKILSDTLIAIDSTGS